MKKIWLTVGAITLAMIFGVLNGHAETPSINDFEEARYIAAIIKEYPASDERHQFAIAMRRVEGLLIASATDENFFLSFRAFPLIKPFLKSHNDKIRVCAEDMTRFIKSGIKVQLLVQPPDDSTCEEVKRALAIATQAENKVMASYSIFLRSCALK